jgi:hypothetical protein
MRRAGLHRYVGVTGAGIDVTRRRPKPWNMTPIGQPLLRSCDGPTSPSSSWTSWSRASIYQAGSPGRRQGGFGRSRAEMTRLAAVSRQP